MKTVEEILDESGELHRVRMVREGATSMEMRIYCPFCGTEFVDQEEDEPLIEEDFKVSCRSCEKLFIVRMTLTYSTRKP